MGMQDTENRSQEALKRLDDSPDLVDIMVSIEDYFDTSNLYVFKNWMDGELIDGPYVEPYWIRVSFKWPYKCMPDPTGGLRLTQHGTKIFFRIAHENVPQPVKSKTDYQPGTVKPKILPEKIWVVEFLIPRRFIEEIEDKVLDLYSERTDDIDSAQDSKIDNSEEKTLSDMGAENAAGLAEASSVDTKVGNEPKL